MLNLAVMVLCSAGVVFLLRVLTGLLKEAMSARPREFEIYWARFSPSQKRDGLIVIHPERLKRDLSNESGERIAS